MDKAIKSSADTKSIVTYTVKVYYTPQFAATTSNIDAFIDQVIQETNLGYINSQENEMILSMKWFDSFGTGMNDLSNSR